MKSVNLIPASRLVARRTRLHRGRCVGACAAYGALLLGACVVSHCVWGGTDQSVEGHLAEASADIDRTAKVIASVKSELDAAESTLRAGKSIVEQPDWSLLM